MRPGCGKPSCTAWDSHCPSQEPWWPSRCISSDPNYDLLHAASRMSLKLPLTPAASWGS